MKIRDTVFFVIGGLLVISGMVLNIHSSLVYSMVIGGKTI